ncbi:hypothetical protein CXT76_01280 [Candidatus Parvarchaeota archaeon]|jgi:hypothetical protein|nr:MAG: hypothetical protein CXT76_01280 [Candidatus Parvarchaeota archaeon]HIG52003.1 hypothetical protein [Candidatus Pacearchaeota archaeon]
MILKKAQSAIEFVIIVGAVAVFVIIFLGVINANISEKTRENRDLVMQEIAFAVQDEINLAFRASEGYSRQFELPSDLLGLEYKLRVKEGSIYVRSTNEKHAMALSTLEDDVLNVNYPEGEIDVSFPIKIKKDLGMVSVDKVNV